MTGNESKRVVSKRYQPPKRKTEGALLVELYYWSEKKSIEDFVKLFNRTRQWYNNAKKWEKIPLKEKIAIVTAYNIAIEYFDGDFPLPKRIDDTGSYNTHELDLINEIQEMKTRYISIQEKVIALQDRIIELTDQLKK